MVDLLRKTLIFASCWLVVASTTHGQQPTSARNDGSPVSWQELQGVRLEELPAIPGQPEDWNAIYRKRFSMDPAVVAPDFGRRPRLRWKSVRPLPDSRAVRADLFDQAERRQRPARSEFRPESRSEFRTGNWYNAIVGDSRQAASRPAHEPTDQPVEVLARSIPVKAVAVDFETIPQPAASVEELPVESLPVSLQPPKVSVNLRLLAQRIEAHNLSVASIEDRLVTRERWDERGLESVISQINEVRTDRSFWSMYWSLLEADRQRRLGRVASLDSMLEKLRQRIFETRVEADLSQDSVSTRKHQQTMRRLAELDRQVVQWQREEG